MFQFMPISSCPFAGYHWEESGSVFFIPTPHIYMHLTRSLPGRLFSGLNSFISLSLPSWVRSSSASVIFVAFNWAHSSMSLSFLYWGAQTWTQYFRWEEQKDSLPQPTGNAAISIVYMFCGSGTERSDCDTTKNFHAINLTWKILQQF